MTHTGVEAWCDQVAYKAFADGSTRDGLIVTYSIIASALGGDPDHAQEIMDRAYAVHQRSEQSKQEAERLRVARIGGVQFR